MSTTGSSSGSVSLNVGNNLNPTIVDFGMVSGLNTQAIINAELQPFQQPITNLQNEQSTLNNNVGYYQQINTDLLAMQTDASQLASPAGWNARSATSSDSSVATATAAGGTPTGSVQFTVQQLAAANSLVSSGTATSTSQVVTSQPDLLLSEGGGQIGFSSLANGSGVALGAHSFQVTQASQAASATGTVALGSQASGITVTTGSNDTITAVADGKTYNLVLAASPTGGYSGSGLLAAVNSAISAAGASGVLQAGYDSSGHLILSTVDQGSTQTLSLSGNGLTNLGLGATSSTGVDAVVKADGTSNTISTVVPGQAVTLNGASGATFTATLAGTQSQTYADSSLVSLGTVNATNVSTGSGSLADVVSNINAAGTGIVASAVQTGTNQYVLQLSSSTTGTNGDLSMSTSAFASSSLGAMNTAVAGQNAEIRIGGSSGFTVSSQTDTFTGLMSGLSLSVNQTSTNPVTVTVGNDVSSIAGSVNKLVTDANTVLGDLQKYAGYDQSTKTAGPLMGSATLQGLTQQILAAVASAVGTSNLGSAANVGITISNGQLSFDQTKFESAYNANPSAVQSLFTQGGTFSPSSSSYAGQASLVYASDNTHPGTYAVNVTQSATQAQMTGATLSSGTVSAAETLTVSMGSSSATYSTSAGQSLTDIAAGLNSAFATEGMNMSAVVVGGTKLQLVSSDYGSGASFSVSTTNTASGTLGLTGGASSASATGLDVAGTINGVAATGQGQFLNAPASDPTLAGLSLQVTAPGITSSTNIGSFTYSPGLAQVLSTIATSMSDPSTGAITETVKGLQTQSVNLAPQIQMYQNIYNQQQKMLMAEYATMEAQLGSLKSQSSALAGELASITGGGSGGSSSSSSGG